MYSAGTRSVGSGIACTFVRISGAIAVTLGSAITCARSCLVLYIIPLPFDIVPHAVPPSLPFAASLDCSYRAMILCLRIRVLFVNSANLTISLNLLGIFGQRRIISWFNPMLPTGGSKMILRFKDEVS